MGPGVIPPGYPNFLDSDDVLTVQVLAWRDAFASQGGHLFRVGAGYAFGIALYVRMLPVGFSARGTVCIAIEGCRVCPRLRERG